MCKDKEQIKCDLDEDARLNVASFIGTEQGLLQAASMVEEAAVLFFRRRDDESATTFRALAAKIAAKASGWRAKADEIDDSIPHSQ